MPFFSMKSSASTITSRGAPASSAPQLSERSAASSLCMLAMSAGVLVSCTKSMAAAPSIPWYSLCFKPEPQPPEQPTLTHQWLCMLTSAPQRTHKCATSPGRAEPSTCAAQSVHSSWRGPSLLHALSCSWPGTALLHALSCRVPHLCHGTPLQPRSHPPWSHRLPASGPTLR